MSRPLISSPCSAEQDQLKKRMSLRKALKSNKAALRQNRKEKLKKRWQQEWDASNRAAKFRSLGVSPPSDRFIKLISDDKISRNDASRIFQLRAGHVPLNAYLE